MMIITPEEELEQRRHSFARLKPGRLFSARVNYATRYFIAVDYKGGEDRVWQVLELHQHNREILARNAQKQIGLAPHGVHDKPGPYIRGLSFDDMDDLSVLCIRTRSERDGDFDRSSEETWNSTYRAFLNNPGNYEDISDWY